MSRPVCLERVLFGMAGGVVFLSIVLALLVSPWFLLLAAFAGVNQGWTAVAGFCPASLILRRAGRFETGCGR